MRDENRKWLDKAVIYQVYPTSFYDANGDGTGDFQGIKEKLYYIKNLGADAIWINPFFKSPFKDGGYDIEDYRAVDGRFGTMEDFDDLIQECKKLGIKVLIDLVIGHTSDRHEWFKKSAEKDRNEYSDYYIWTDSIFNKYQDKTIHGLYDRNGGYYINYYACQPALNFGFNETGKTEINAENDYDMGDGWKMRYDDERLKPLRNEITEIMLFWLRKGVDGFRVDMANSLVKGCVYDSDKEEDIKGLRWLWNELFSAVKKEFPRAVFLAEWCSPENAVKKCGFDFDYLGHDNAVYNDLFRNEKGNNLLPSFERGYNYFSKRGKGSVRAFIDYAVKLHESLGNAGGFSAPSGCHDSVRLAEGTDADELKVAFAFLFTFKHIPMLYYGDEIGLAHDFSVSKDGGYIRTGARTPMQWNDGKNRGFSTAETLYLPVNGIAEQCVEVQEKDENSLLNTVKKLIGLRKRYSCLDYASRLKVIECDDGYPLIYERENEECAVRVYISPSSEKIKRKCDGKPLYAVNAEITDGEISLNGSAFAIVLTENKKKDE